MKIGIYCNNVKSDIFLCAYDLVTTLSGNKNITLCLPKWLGQQKAFSEFKNVQYLSAPEFFELQHFYVFVCGNSFVSKWLTKKDVCFVIEGLTCDITNLPAQIEQLEARLSRPLDGGRASFISHFHKKLNAPFDSLFSSPKAKFRNCFITNDALIKFTDTSSYDPSLDIIVPYQMSPEQLLSYDKSEQGLFSPTDAHASFQQALLAENIFIEPDVFDVYPLSKALKELAFTDKQFSSKSEELNKLFNM